MEVPSGASCGPARHCGKAKLPGKDARVLDATLNLRAVEKVLLQRADENTPPARTDRDIQRQQAELQVCAGVVRKAFEEVNKVEGLSYPASCD